MKLNKFVFISVIALSTFFFAAKSEADGPKKPASSAPPSHPQPSSKPKFSSPAPVQKQEPKFSAPPHNVPKDEEKPKFSAPQPENKPKFSSPDAKLNPTGSDKPKSGTTSDKARANKEQRSETKFIETQKAVAPPKTKYTSPEGDEVKVRTATKDVEHIRSMPSASLKPEVRQQVIITHVDNYHYQRPYTYYQSQPAFYVGGGYSSAFWWMMLEWDAERRARWLYNHQYDITQEAYQRGLQDAKSAEAIRRLEQQRVYRDPNYTDPEFKSDPSLQYTDEYIRASYNPPIHKNEPADASFALNVLAFLGSIVLGGLILWGLYVIFFVVRWGK